MTTYNIKRMYAPGRKERDYIIKTGLTLEEAQAWCKREDTHEKGVFFDGYDEE